MKVLVYYCHHCLWTLEFNGTYTSSLSKCPKCHKPNLYTIAGEDPWPVIGRLKEIGILPPLWLVRLQRQQQKDGMRDGSDS